MNRDKVRELHTELNQTLLEFAKKHGLTYKPGRLTYTTDEVWGKVTFAEVPEDAVTGTPAALTAREVFFLKQHGLDDTAIGREFTFYEKRWKFVGLAITRKKWPMRAMNMETREVKLLPKEALASLKL